MIEVAFDNSQKITCSRNHSIINPYPANVDNMASLLSMLANGGWDLIQRLKGLTEVEII